MPASAARNRTTYVNSLYTFSFPSGYLVRDLYAANRGALIGQVIFSKADGLQEWELTLQMIALGEPPRFVDRDFAIEQARLTCVADGMDVSVACPDAFDIHFRKSRYGVFGFRMLLWEKRIDKSATIIRRRGPVAVIQVSPTLAVVVSYDGLQLNDRNRQLFSSILRSLRSVDPEPNL
jgi:hypothetical protein